MLEGSISMLKYRKVVPGYQCYKVKPHFFEYSLLSTCYVVKAHFTHLLSTRSLSVHRVQFLL